jgi:uncharacterized protein YndB with AHSA1/START domain
MKQITIERTFNAPVEMIWEIWTEPEFIMRWFGGDPDGTVDHADVDLRRGGKYRITFHDCNGSEHTAFGEYLEVIEAKSLKYTWEWVSEPGHVSEVWVSFHGMGDQSKIVLTHLNLHPGSAHGYEGGWNNAIDKIVKLLLKV